jgi:hypothetical protein
MRRRQIAGLLHIVFQAVLPMFLRGCYNSGKQILFILTLKRFDALLPELFIR